MKKQKLMILQGLPASGKSTFVKNYMNSRNFQMHGNGKRNHDINPVQYVSSDEIRFNCLPHGIYHETEIPDQGFQHLVNNLVWETVHEQITLFLMGNNDVILDATNLQRRWWMEYQKYRNDEVAVVGIQIQSDLSRIIERDAKRDRIVGKEIIEQMEKDLEPMVNYQQDFDKLIIINHP